MMKTLILASTVVAGLFGGAAGPAIAQDAGAPAPQDSTADGGAGVRSGHITSTGATVPNPGASQSGGTTPMDRGVQQRDNKIDSSICKGC